MTSRRSGIKEGAAVTLLAIVLVGYFTFPLVLRPGSLGRTDSGDGQFSIWNVAWVARALITPGQRLFDANIFHPRRGTLAYSEANLGAGLLAVPGYALTRNPYVAHNTAFLLGLVLSVIGMYYLARRLSGSRPGAVVAAIVFSFCPYLFAHTAHIQLLMIGPLPFVFLALHAWVDAPTPRRAVVLGLTIGAQALFCAYYGILAGLLAGFCVVFYSVSRGQWRRPGWWGSAALAAAVSIVLVLPFFLPYVTLQRDTGFGRTLDEARLYAADWRAYFASNAWLHTWMLPYLGKWKEVLFPGVTALTCGVIGAVAGLRRGGQLRETTAVYLCLGVLAIWSSFGPAAGLYSLLYHTIPVFSLLRAPARFGVAVSFALAILSAIGVAALLRGLARGRRRVVGAVVIAAAVLDLSMTMPFRPVPPVPEAYRVLAASRPGSVVELPFFYHTHDFYRHSRYMLGSTFHWLPLINGYSDYIPTDFMESAFPLASFPNPEGFALLRARRARYAVFHLALYDSTNRAALRRRLEAYREFLRPLVQEEDVWLFEIVRWPDVHPPLG